jgi:aldehyde:ferredoxin oxidoreductase
MDVCDAAASLKFHLMTNQLGLDSDFAAVVCSWAFECYEKGLITPEDTEGLELVWGNGEAMVELERLIAYREGIGDLLADGVKEASRRLGQGSEKFAIHCKGQDSVDPYRIMKGFGLGLATSPVGGRHLRGAVTSQATSGPKHIPFSPNEYKNQPEVVFWQARAKEIEDMTGVCNYMGTWTGAHALDMADYAELISTAMGVDIDENQLIFIGQQGYNLEKAFNTLHAGFTRTDDLPPARYMEEEVKSGKFAGYKCDPEEWVRLLDRFYELQGWDKETSWQTEQGLKELKLEDVAQRLKEAGRIIEH